MNLWQVPTVHSSPIHMGGGGAWKGLKKMSPVPPGGIQKIPHPFGRETFRGH